MRISVNPNHNLRRRYLKIDINIVIIFIIIITDPEARVRFPALPDKKVVGLEQGPLSLVSTTEELHW
jgi:hypothetical protein